MIRKTLRFSGISSIMLAGFLATSATAAEPAAEVLKKAPADSLIIHYHRFDGVYENPGLWTWDQRRQKEPTNQEVLATGQSDYGVYFVLRPGEYGNDDGPEEQIGFIPRLKRDWNLKDGTDRVWTPKLGREIWLIGNDPRIYTARPDTSPRVSAAHIDGESFITAVLSKPLTTEELAAAKATVKDASGALVPVAAIRPAAKGGERIGIVEVVLSAPLDFIGNSYTVAVNDLLPAKAVKRRVLDDPRLFFTKDPMGAVYTPEQTTFRLFSPTAREMSVVLYDAPTGAAGRTFYPMEKRKDGVWEATVTGDLEGKHYRMLVSTDVDKAREFSDPLATNTTGDDGHPRITDLRALDPEGFRPIARPAYGNSPTDAIIYQLHVRDFTVTPSSGVAAEHRGKYLGLTDTTTTLPSDASITTGISHLKEMGVTHVQIQPFHDWDNDEDKPDYNWGYMTAFFNSPEGSLATEIRTSARVSEVKQMVKALHDAKIGVILDVVYNHTGVQNTFEIAAPGYYHRMKDDGSFWNGSGTGNEVRSEAPMARQFIIDSLKLWMNEYGVDGFRFDLLGLIDLETLKQIQAELRKDYPNVLVYGEPWAATGPDGTGAARLTYKDVVRGTGIGAFNDHFRDAIKGSPDGNDAGYIVNGMRRDGILKGIMGSIDDWAASPVESINYADVHDNLILFDKLKYSAAGLSDDDRKKAQMLSAGILSVSQGIMLLHSGAEFLRSKQGNHNSYNAGDEINGVRWELKKQNADVVEFYKGVIALRKAHPIFRLQTAEEVRKRVKNHDANRPAPETIVITLDGKGLAGEEWAEAIVLINPTAAEQVFQLPIPGRFDVYVLGDKAGTSVIGKGMATFAVPARSMAVLGRPGGTQ